MTEEYLSRFRIMMVEGGFGVVVVFCSYSCLEGWDQTKGSAGSALLPLQRHIGIGSNYQ